LMKVTEKSGFFRALPWLAQSGIVRAVFRGRHPARPAWRCRSSVVEHVLGKDGVGSSILLGSTIISLMGTCPIPIPCQTPKRPNGRLSGPPKRCCAGTLGRSSIGAFLYSSPRRSWTGCGSQSGASAKSRQIRLTRRLGSRAHSGATEN
jgi:hypothetical protein